MFKIVNAKQARIIVHQLIEIIDSYLQEKGWIAENSGEIRSYTLGDLRLHRQSEALQHQELLEENENRKTASNHPCKECKIPLTYKNSTLVSRFTNHCLKCWRDLIK